MATLTWHTFLLVANFLIISVFYVKTDAQEAHRPWYENLPAVAMDYKVHVEAGKEDCYFQYVQPGATFYASYSVNI